MACKASLLFCLMAVVALMITSEVVARVEPADTSNAANSEVKGTENSKFYYGGGGYGGGYPGGGGGGYCQFGCCGRRDFRGFCLRCCGLAAEAADSQVEDKPHN